MLKACSKYWAICKNVPIFSVLLWTQQRKSKLNKLILMLRLMSHYYFVLSLKRTGLSCLVAT